MSGRQPPARRVRPFTPSQESPAVLSDRTVGRESTLEIMVARLVDAARSGNRAHTMLVGPRGSGKTHLLNVALHRARQQVDVERRLVVVRFDEDAIGVHRYTDILAEAYAGVAASGSRRPRLPDYPERGISEALGDRVLVLAIENADRIFKSLGKQGQQAFRAWVEQSRQIFVLASSPALFKGIQDRALPWWGNFGVHLLDELSLDEGRELLIKLARESGDDELAEFLTTPKAEGRLRAINALAGGSPRVWMILSECLTVETLDELVPAVEALLEGLVPYYQQLLWDLSDVEQRLVRELADGPHHAATVQELAAACEIDQRVAASTLKRLADMRWVRADKSPDLDRRHTWYRLREPLVRHHFQYRSARDQPLPLIVELLKAWYDPVERREQLIRALPGSVAERFVAASLADLGGSLATEYVDRDLRVLQSDARSWVHGAAGMARTRDAGVLIDVAVTAVREGPAAALASIRKRSADPAITERVVQVIESLEPVSAKPEDALGTLLSRISVACPPGDTYYVLELISAIWDSSVDHDSALRRVQALIDQTNFSEADPRYFEIRYVRARLSANAGDYGNAAQYFSDLAEYAARLDVAETYALGFREFAAHNLALSGDNVGARRLMTTLIPQLEQTLGSSHDTTLGARVELLRLNIAIDPPGGHVREAVELAEACESALGGLHQRTVRAKSLLACCYVLSGQVQQAITLTDSLLPAPVPSELTGLLEAVFVQVVAAVLRDPLSTSTPSDNWRDGGLIATVQAAAAGEEEAFMRLPGELADIVRAARAQKVAASG